MGQGEIIEVLIKNYPKYLDYKEIMTLSGLPKDNVIRNLRKAKKRTECEIKIIQGKSGWKTMYRMKG